MTSPKNSLFISENGISVKAVGSVLKHGSNEIMLKL